MIIHLRSSVSAEAAHAMAAELPAVVVRRDECFVLVTSSAMTSVDPQYDDIVDQTFVCDTDMQLASARYRRTTQAMSIGAAQVGGVSQDTVVIAGPCSVESESQIFKSADFLNSVGVTAFRAGCFKPRTSPYSFQGLGLQGLQLLDKVRVRYGLTIVTEVRDATHVDEVIEYADVVQIGAKAMYDHGVLRRCGKSTKPVLLKRWFGSTLQELVQAAEFVLSGGNEQVMLCERGIRTFETKTRFTLDLCGVAFLKDRTNLPIVLDPSHAMGFAYGVPDLAKACVAMGVDGLLLEVHPDPVNAQSDGPQQLTHTAFAPLLQELGPVAKAVGRRLV